MVTKTIGTGDRCQVGLHKNGKFHVWHKVLGPGTRPITVKAEDVATTCKQLLDRWNNERR